MWYFEFSPSVVRSECRSRAFLLPLSLLFSFCLSVSVSYFFLTRSPHPSNLPHLFPLSLSLTSPPPLSSLSLCMCAHFRNAPSEIANLPDDMKAFNDREGSNVVVDKLFVDGDIDLKGQTILCGLILIIWQQELR